MTTTPLVIGVDGGGTKTVAWLAPLDDVTNGIVLGRGHAGPGNPRSVGFETAQQNISAAVKAAFADGRPLPGWQVDDATRAVIEKAGYGEFFVHRTGHSIGQETHGNGANIDNLETREERLILPGCCFSIEPGIYLPEFGVRSEVDVFVDKNRQVHVTAGALQYKVVPILG